MLTNKQSGFGAIIPIVLVGIIALIGVTSFFIYRKKHPSSTFNGTVVTQACQPNTQDCHQQNLVTTDGQSYGLTGLDASSYAGQKVVVSGTVHTEATPRIEVTNIKQDNQTASSTTTTTVSSGSSSFNINQFYDQVQNGMTYQQVVQLAGGQSGDCEHSNAPPPIDYMDCSWHNSATAVSVSFSNQKVTQKSKKDL